MNRWIPFVFWFQCQNFYSLILPLDHFKWPLVSRENIYPAFFINFADVFIDHVNFGSACIWADNLCPASQWKRWKSDIRSSVFNIYIHTHIYICSLSVLGVSSNQIGLLPWGNSALFTHQGLNNAQSKWNKMASVNLCFEMSIKSTVNGFVLQMSRPSVVEITSHMFV